MQHYLPNQAGGGAEMVLSRPSEIVRDQRHRALLLVGSHGPSRLTPRLSRRVLDRLLAPAAQVEGVDFLLGDAGFGAAAAQADAFALVLPPLGNLSNAFYAVHPRRNDRFVVARPSLKALYPEVDFAPMAFTGHALGTLAATCPERFAQVRRAISADWVLRMQKILALLPERGVLIDLPAPAWLSRPRIPGEGRRRVSLDPDDRATGAEMLRNALTAHHA